MLLLPLVENAFKHGSKGDSNKTEIKVNLTVENNQLNFKVFNSMSGKPSKVKKEGKKGIGLANLKRQLELNYPNNYKLKLEENVNSYLVELFINLN